MSSAGRLKEMEWGIVRTGNGALCAIDSRTKSLGHQISSKKSNDGVHESGYSGSSHAK